MTNRVFGNDLWRSFSISVKKSKDELGKTLYTEVRVYMNGPNTMKNLTISCSDTDTHFLQRV